MRIFFILLISLISLEGMSQINRKTSCFLSLQYTKTLKDITLGNNPWGIGVGLQGYYNTGKILRPAVDITADVYLEDDKVGRTDISGAEIKDVRGVLNVFGGVQLQVDKILHLSFVAGPSFINGNTLLGLKPSVAAYLSKRQRCEVKAAYIHVYKRDKVYGEDFTSFSLGLGIKLF